MLDGVCRQRSCETPTCSAHSFVVLTFSTPLASLGRSSITNKSDYKNACRPWLACSRRYLIRHDCDAVPSAEVFPVVLPRQPGKNFVSSQYIESDTGLGRTDAPTKTFALIRRQEAALVGGGWLFPPHNESLPSAGPVAYDE